MRVGFLTNHDPHNPSLLSGMPHSTWKALEKTGVELVDLSGFDSSRNSRGASRNGVGKLIGKPGIGRQVRVVRQRMSEFLLSPWDYQRIVGVAERMSRDAQKIVDAGPQVDLYFGVCTARLLYDLRTPAPVVYVSDTTARLINASYHDRARRSSGFHRASEVVERAALHNCAVFAATSDRTAQSAINDYDVPPERVRVVEMGAHVVPGDMPIDPSPPSKDGIELVLVAADPKRKRLGLCVEVAKELRARGWNATLNFVGPYDPILEGEEAVNWAGRLMLNNPDDRQKHKELLRRSHWMLLPSTAEAFGIAPAEAAHFGRPSAVTDVGGLPTVVKHGHTGIVLPLEAPAAAYADAIIEISGDPARYEAMSQAALERAHTVLCWDAWGKRMLSIFEEVVAGTAAV